MANTQSPQDSAPLVSDAISRRKAVTAGLTAACGCLSFLGRSPAASPQAASEADEPVDLPVGCTLGFSTYGMKHVATEAAIKQIAEIGFDAVELAIRSGWDADSAKLTRARRQQIRACLADNSLILSSLMEHVSLVDKQALPATLQRLAAAAELAQDLASRQPPLIQSVIGGSGDFATSKHQLRDNVGQCLETLRGSGVTLALKPHRGGTVSQPAEALWLFEQLDQPAELRMVYDYSHYAFRNLPLAETIQVALPMTAHIAVKDASQEGGTIVFKLPGEAGTIDFPDILRRFYQGGYRADVSCEVSGMVSNRVNYDASQAADKCYRCMAAAFKTAGVPRRRSR